MPLKGWGARPWSRPRRAPCGCAPATRRSRSRRSRATCSAWACSRAPAAALRVGRGRQGRLARRGRRVDRLRAAHRRGDRPRRAGPAAHLVLGRLRAPLRRRRPRGGGRRVHARRRHRGPDRAAAAADQGARAGRALLRLRRAHSGLEKTASHQVFWNIDPPHGHTAELNNMYTSIPFVLSLQGGAAHGLFLDHPGRVELDLAKADPARMSGTAAGDARLLRLRRTRPPRVLERYTELTGRIAAAAAVGARQPAVALELHGRRRAARHRPRLPRARHPLRRAVPRHRLHGRLPRLHLGRRALPGPEGADRRAGARRLPRGHDRRPGREGRPGLPRLHRGARPRPVLPHVHGRGVQQRRLARPVRVPGLHHPAHARVVGRPARARCSTQGVAGIWAT